MSPTVRRLAWFVAPLMMGGCAGAQRALEVPTAMAAHEVCSSIFISHFDGDRAFASTVAPQLGPFSPLLRRTVDPRGRSVTASLGPFATRRASYQAPYGCIVGGRANRLPSIEAPAAPRADVLRVSPDQASPALVKALDLAFEEAPKGPRRRTYAAVIVHDGRIVAERYAPGVDSSTPLHGWSMSKSVTNALLGVLVRQRRLHMYAAAPAPEWRAASDPRHAITADDLLRMRSGLDVGQSLASDWSAPFDRANQIMFAARDMAGEAASRPLAAPPRSLWKYSDGNTAILGRVIRQTVGGSALTQAFARRELFDALGMGPVILETDATGSPIGATQVYASARDWARLGQLFLDDGVAGSQRVLPSGWVAYSTRLTPGSEAYGYGAGFWISRVPQPAMPGMPAGSFMARGARGQYVVVVPSARLVVVKLGDADTPRGDFDQMAQVVEAAVRAVVDPHAVTEQPRTIARSQTAAGRAVSVGPSGHHAD